MKLKWQPPILTELRRGYRHTVLTVELSLFASGRVTHSSRRAHGWIPAVQSIRIHAMINEILSDILTFSSLFTCPWRRVSTGQGADASTLYAVLSRNRVDGNLPSTPRTIQSVFSCEATRTISLTVL